MRKINLIVIHCSATRCNRPYTEAYLLPIICDVASVRPDIIIMYA